MDKKEEKAVREDGKKKYERHALKSDARAVLAFLDKCTPFEADAIRVITTKKISDMSPEAKDAVNAYLDFGSGGKDVCRRIERAEQLVNNSLDLIESADLPRITASLMRLATDVKASAKTRNAPTLPLGESE